MSFYESLGASLKGICASEKSSAEVLERVRRELEFAGEFADLFPDKKKKWQELILKAADAVKSGLAKPGPVDAEAIAEQAEQIMAPIGKAAKEYTIHCCGHAHIDMNWLWAWEETISAAHDTFVTVDRLMDEFPTLKFSQDQVSIYAGMEEYCPEIFEMIKKRIKEGRWEPTASMWVEGDKNISSGEILCRHLLYSRRYLKEKLGLPYDAVKIDWECDTFGHAHTLPSILNRGGVTRYYHTRTGPKKWLYWWKAPDGSKVLTFHDKDGYNGEIDETIVKKLYDYIKETGLKDFMFLYGLGDHGGGPTRKDLVNFMKMDSWPIYPSVKLSTTDEYYSKVEKAKPDLFVHDGEMNFIFEGCYTTQSNIKLANRVSENVIPEVEAVSLIAGTVGFPYPQKHINEAWRKAMFNQFHDILPGSGIPDTYKYSQGLFQDIKAITGSIRTRALRKLAGKIDTASPWGLKPPTGKLGETLGVGVGAGAGDHRIPGGISARSMGAVDAEPVVVFNQLPFERSEMVTARIWNKEVPHDRIRVRDDAGNETAGQVIETGRYWGHQHTTIVFPAKNVPALGYRTYLIDEAAKPVKTDAVKIDSFGSFENEYLRVEMDFPSGAIKHLIDKATGHDYVPEGGLLGVLELHREAPHSMSAWEIGRVQKIEMLTEEGRWFERVEEGRGTWNSPLPSAFAWRPFAPTELQQKGPQRVAIKVGRRVGNSHVWTEVGLSAGIRAVEIKIFAEWVEMGTPQTGVPTLKMAFAVNVSDPEATYEIPFGSMVRETAGQEVPALKWADLSGGKAGGKGKCGLTILNSHKYGHSADGSTMRVTLIRPGYEPDPLPEMGEHDIKLTLVPHEGACKPSEAARGGAAQNLPMSVISADVHKGTLPSKKSYVEVLTPNVMIASVKKAEDSRAVVVRLYEMDGKAVEAKVRMSDIVKPGAKAAEVDLMEQPLKKSAAKMDGDVLKVKIPAHGIASVMIG